MSDQAGKQLVRNLTPRLLRILIRRPSKTFHWIRNELKGLAGIGVPCTMLDGWTVQCHPVCAQAFRAEVEDPDQRLELADFAARCAQGMILFDIGASFGSFTLATLHYGGSTARAVTVDPSPVSNRILRRNVALAGGEARVQSLEGAVGTEDGELAMLSTGPAGEHYFISTDEIRSDARRVPQFTLPSLAARVGLVPTHLKIDVEGFEAEVLHGGLEWLRRCQPLLFLELHVRAIRDRGQQPDKVLELLAAAGYGRFERHGTTISAEDLLKFPLVRFVSLPAPGGA